LSKILVRIAKDEKLTQLEFRQLPSVNEHKKKRNFREISRKESSAGESLFAALLISFGRSLGFIKYID